jgi:hypothetical protein
MLCSIDPATANLLVPVAQASIISAPILLRDQIRRGVGAVRAHVRGGAAPEDADDTDEPSSAFMTADDEDPPPG